MKYNVSVWPRYSAKVTFAEIATSIYNYLSQYFECTIGYNFDNTGEYTNIILGANDVSSVKLEIPPNSIIINLEQLADGQQWATPVYIDLLKQFQVWEYSESNIDYLKSKGITKIKKFNVGYEKSLETIAGGKPPNQAIDVLFFGAINVRRNNIKERLERTGISVVFMNNVYGENRDRLISQSKVVINIHYFESKILEVVRISHLLANRKCVISEPSCEQDVDNEWGKGVVFADYDHIVEKVLEYVNNTEMRQSQEKKAYNFITNYPLRLPIENLPTTAQ